MRTVLVTGGTRGIGAAIAKYLHANAYHVIVSYFNNHDKANAFYKETDMKPYCFDVSSAAACQDGVAQIVENHGPIEILVHNAGITRDGFCHKMSKTMWDDVIQTNLSSCFYMVHPIIESMRAAQFGRIVCMSSINAVKGQVGQTNYSAAKAGVIGFVKALALENAKKGITVNAVAPGYTDTEMVSAMNSVILDKIVQLIPMQRLGTVDEIARMVGFLVADDASYITGSVFSINGGLV